MHSVLFAFLEQYGLPAIFLLIMVENMGVPAPTEVAYVVAQTLITQGKLSYGLALLVLTSAHVVGSLLSYLLGRKISRRFPTGHPSTGVVQRLTEWYGRYGYFATFGARFIGQVRPWSSYVAGAAQERWEIFVVSTIVGSLLFSIISLAFTTTLAHAWQAYPWIRPVFGAIFVASLLWFIFELTRKKPTAKTPEPEE
jgi:membrane protein DedA with SNARE-associated domain